MQGKKEPEGCKRKFAQANNVGKHFALRRRPIPTYKPNATPRKKGGGGRRSLTSRGLTPPDICENSDIANKKE